MIAKRTLEVDALNVYHGAHHVLRDLAFAAQPGEFISLLGPSGSGKTTLLMTIAGFISPLSGKIVAGGENIIDLPPHQRRMGMVFQNYALFPHMSIAANVGYSLRIQKLNKAGAKKKINDLLRLIHLEHYGRRMPNELSGGQQQRVAIARALASDPSVLLMDEPLSALDKRLREEMLVEIRRIHDDCGVTTLYVTHDQREALTISDRVAVMNGGKIIQIGTPQEIYNNPVDRFVASFIGEASFLPVSVLSGRVLLNGIPFGGSAVNRADGDYLLVIRPERVRIKRADESQVNDGYVMSGQLESLIFQGDSIVGQIRVGAHLISFRCLNQGASSRYYAPKYCVMDLVLGGDEMIVVPPDILNASRE